MRFVLAVMGLLAGCGPENNDCELETGGYRTTFVEVSGTCGPIDGQDVALAGDLGPPFSGANSEDCGGRFDFTDDMCSVDFDRTCEARDVDGALLGTARFIGTSTIVGPTRAESTVTVQRDEPGASCVSTYEVTWTIF